MTTTRNPCPFRCGGEVATDDEMKKISHTAPLCSGFEEFLATGPKPVAVYAEELDDSGAPVKRNRA